jgi:hypothetical protein
MPEKSMRSHAESLCGKGERRWEGAVRCLIGLGPTTICGIYAHDRHLPCAAKKPNLARSPVYRAAGVVAHTPQAPAVGRTPCR